MNALEFTDTVSKLRQSHEMAGEPEPAGAVERMLDSLIGLAREAIATGRAPCPQYCQHQRRNHAHRGGFVVEGIAYDEELRGPDGMAFMLLPGRGVKGGEILAAKAKLRRDRDVVGLAVEKWARCFVCDDTGWVAK